jgi:hypothetical protein
VSIKNLLSEVELLKSERLLFVSSRSRDVSWRGIFNTQFAQFALFDMFEFELQATSFTFISGFAVNA